MDLVTKQSQFASNLSRLIDFIQCRGYLMTVGEVYRPACRAEWYADKGIGVRDSLHCKRLAVDIQLYFDGKLLSDGKHFEQFGEFWETLHPHNRWGGRFTREDYSHFERQDLK